MALTDKQKATLKKHSVHHSKKHMALMNSLMNKGKSFKFAHRQALKIAGKQVAKKKTNLLNKETHETRAKYKKTSIGRRPSTAMMNKKKTFKRYVGQGK